MRADYSIREAAPADAARLIAYMRVLADEPDNGIGYASADEFPYTVEQEAELVAKYAVSDTHLFLVAEADGEIIGMAECHGGQRGLRFTAELGLSVRQGWRRRGVGTALMQYMIGWARANPHVHRLELQVYPDNARAIALYEKLGFVHEGTRRQAFYKAGAFLDLMMMSIVFGGETP
jgi:RimJ/RimL family protein N-acetyltransferase